MKKLKYAQDLLKTVDEDISGGFNSFVLGERPPPYPSSASRLYGYNIAKIKSIDEGMAFTNRFKCGKSNKCYPFDYGGNFVCNDCGRNNLAKTWWKIQVEKDGDAYCCHGLDFINQEKSDNFAFGNTFENAIKKYGELMLKNNN